MYLLGHAPLGPHHIFHQIRLYQQNRNYHLCRPIPPYRPDRMDQCRRSLMNLDQTNLHHPRPRRLHYQSCQHRRHQLRLILHHHNRRR